MPLQVGDRIKARYGENANWRELEGIYIGRDQNPYFCTVVVTKIIRQHHVDLKTSPIKVGEIAEIYNLYCAEIDRPTIEEYLTSEHERVRALAKGSTCQKSE